MKTEERKDFYKLLKSGKLADMVNESTKGQEVGNAQEVYNIMKPLAAQTPDVEHFWMIFLDSQNNILEISMLFKGTIMSSVIYPREIIKKVLDCQAVSVIGCHNHPSGDPTPSQQDIDLTANLIADLATIDVAFFDHIIIGAGKYYSMAEKGFINKMAKRLKSARNVAFNFDL